MYFRWVISKYIHINICVETANSVVIGVSYTYVIPYVIPSYVVGKFSKPWKSGGSGQPWNLGATNGEYIRANQKHLAVFSGSLELNEHPLLSRQHKICITPVQSTNCIGNKKGKGRQIQPNIDKHMQFDSKVVWCRIFKSKLPSISAETIG